MTLHTKKTGRKTDFCKRLAENFFRRGSCEKTIIPLMMVIVSGRQLCVENLRDG